MQARQKRSHLSVNDGRKNSYGGIHLWSTGASGGITNTTFYANSIYMSQSADGKPSVVDCMQSGIRNIRFYNNRFQTDGNAVLVRGKTNGEVVFKDNTVATNCESPQFPTYR